MINENIHRIQQKIKEKCAEAGRNSDDVTLIAVSKTFPSADIRKAYEYGLVNFGENKAQELRNKFDELADLNDRLRWHFIGTLQKNKVKYLIDSTEYIHSVDSQELADEINKRMEKAGHEVMNSHKKKKILIEVKTSGEETKAGIENKKEVIDLLNHCKNLSSVEVVGLMTIAPFTEDKNLIRNSFASLRKLRDRLNTMGFNLKELSMGMTSDFEIAIEEGATFLRIGTAIFGQRTYTNKPEAH